MQIDETGESWVGSGQPVATPNTAGTARVEFWISQEPYWIDIPFSARPGEVASSSRHCQLTNIVDVCTRNST